MKEHDVAWPDVERIAVWGEFGPFDVAAVGRGGAAEVGVACVGHFVVGGEGVFGRGRRCKGVEFPPWAVGLRHGEASGG